MRNKSKGGVHAGQNAPEFVFGRRNLDYVGTTGGASGRVGAVSGSRSRATGDFNSGGSQVIHHPKAMYESNPAMEYEYDEYDYDGDYYYQDQIDIAESDMREEVQSTVSEWAENMIAGNNGVEPEYVLMEMKNIGWMRRSDTLVVPLEKLVEDPVGFIQPRGTDVTQTWENNEGVLSVSQSHHDQQYESYTFRPLPPE